MVKLRKVFDLKHRVELLEDHLRKRFLSWLQLCQQKITTSVVYDGKLIIVLEGMELFKEPGTLKESNAKFWLPSDLPKDVRLILTST